MYTTYTIGEMAKILGVTAQTIRYYEQKKIIEPIVSANSGYRYYTTWDLHMLIRARCYLGFGFTIDEVADLLKKENIEQIDKVLEKQEQILQEKIIYQMNVLKKLRQNRSLISDIKNNQQSYIVKKRPGIYRINTQRCYSIDLSKEQLDDLKFFSKKVPFLFSTAVFKKEDILNQNTEFDFGVGVEEQFAKGLEISENDNIQYYPPQLCLYLSIPSRSSKLLNYQVLQPAFDYMEKHNLVLAGDIISQIVLMCKPQEEYFNWHHIYIPIE